MGIFSLPPFCQSGFFLLFVYFFLFFGLFVLVTQPIKFHRFNLGKGGATSFYWWDVKFATFPERQEWGCGKSKADSLQLVH